MNVACAQPSPEVRRRLIEMENRDDLALVGPLNTLSLSDGTVLGAFDTRQESRGISPIAVSPDGEFVGWYPTAPIYPPPIDKQKAFIGDGKAPPRALSVDGRISMMAISNQASCAAVIATRSEESGLFIFDNRRKLADSPVINRLRDLSAVERMRMSADGSRLVLGSRTHFQLFDIPSMNLLAVSRGRYPTLSPSGHEIAAVVGDSIAIRSTSGNSTRVVPTDLRVEFVAGWSPNGQFLLAGGPKALSLADYRLIAVDTMNGSFCEILKAPDEIPSNFWWIRRRFAS
jgi:hypothetical protein